ncbi:MAG: AMP-binding protein [Clostridiales bacterium]|nr:AMP-binding protein [Clostridiales bacterium]
MISYENTKTIYDLVTSAGNIHGNKVFLRFEDNDEIKEVSYQKFAEECQEIAAWAEAKNKELGRKVRIGVIGGSSNEYLAALLGVMCNGNVVVPLDTQLNFTALGDCVNRADIDILFYDWEHYELIEGLGEICSELKTTICLQNRKHVDCIQKIFSEYKGQKVEPKIQEEECAMVLFTSGTTGKSKGVMLSHRNLIDNVFCYTDPDDQESAVYMNVLPIHHVYCLTEDILVTLRYGCVLCLNQDLAKLVSHIQLFQPTVIRMVPMMAKTLYSRIAILKEQNKDKSIDEVKEMVLGKNLHKIISGGGYLAPELAECFQDIGMPIAQGYGMSECSPKVAGPDWSRPDKVPSLGKVVERCEVRIIDGEIQVKSPSVMMGYYKDEEETAKAITEDGWLRTGDLGYVDEEGFLYFTGRSKNLIILSNGENVAPEQIENLFDNEPLIEDILVYGEEDRICAEVYPNFKLAEAKGIEDIEKVVEEIIKKHNEELPTFKRIMQSGIRQIPFEKTSSKKIIRGKYFEQKKKEKDETANLRKPENEMQQKLYNAVSECLGHDLFGIDTDFYQAGLDSLASVLLLTELFEKFKISITLKELSENATIEKLEVYAANQKENDVDYTKREIYPLTSLQMYFGYVLRGNSTSNLPFLFKLDNSVDLERLKWATEEVFEIHVELKDIIQVHEGVLKNFRDDNRKIDIPIITMTDKEWEKAREELIRPFLHQENEPLYHAGIYKTDSGNYFFFDLAHIIGDGMSMNILFEDINALYKGEKVEKQDYSYYEYILDQMHKDEQGQKAENVRYCLGLTKDLKMRKTILLRKDCYDLEHGINSALRDRLNVNHKKILGYCKKNGVSENVIFLTAFNYCVGVFANEDDVMTTSVHSGRTDSRWNRLIGSLFMTYYFRYTRKPHETVAELLKKSGKQILHTMDNYISNIHADEMFFQYQGDILNINEIGGAPAERQSVQLDALPLHFQVFSDSEGYFYELRYWENRFDKELLEIFVQCYECILNAMLEETSVRRLKKHIPEQLHPKHFYIEAGKINEEAGYELIPNVAADTKVKAYVLDDSCIKKPYGGWGDLYIMDYPTKDYLDEMANPYGDGTLYLTGRTARITPSGKVEFIEDAGRSVMQETVRGREFPDLYQIEQAICSYDGMKKAEAYTFYSSDNNIHIGADLWGENEVAPEVLKEFLADKIKESWIPEQLQWNK